jgi:hypothetical protein
LYMTREDIQIAVVINVLTGSLFFVLGLFWRKIWILRRPLVRWFFGKGIFGADFRIVHGSIIDSRIPSAQPTDVRFLKVFHDGRKIGMPGPWGNVLGDAEIRAFSYLTSELSLYRDVPLEVLDDVTAFPNVARSFLSLGSPSSNELSDFSLRQSENKFLEFAQDSGGVFVRSRKNNEVLRAFEYRGGKDLGIVLKIPNARFRGHYFFVCAGLGEWGTSSAAWYLARNWRRLPWSRKGFGVVVEVDPHSDTTAREILRVAG